MFNEKADLFGIWWSPSFSVQAVFNRCDADKSGSIDVNELGRLSWNFASWVALSFAVEFHHVLTKPEFMVK